MSNLTPYSIVRCPTCQGAAKYGPVLHPQVVHPQHQQHITGASLGDWIMRGLGAPNPGGSIAPDVSPGNPPKSPGVFTQIADLQKLMILSAVGLTGLFLWTQRDAISKMLGATPSVAHAALAARRK